MVNKEFITITEVDLHSLVENGVGESRTIEYKKELLLKSDHDKKEFLADISSFANSSGGDLLIGVKADNGIPNELTGLDTMDKDGLILQIETLIRDGIAPRLSDIQISGVPLTSGRFILLVRIGKGWNIPHQVIIRGTNKFYNRGTNGKYQMDIDELRNAFTATTSNEEKMTKYIEQRRIDIISNVLPFPFEESAKIVLHLIPASSMDKNKRYDLGANYEALQLVREINGKSTTPRFTLHGWISSSQSPGPERLNYVQVSQNGIIEAVNGEILFPYGNLLRIPVSKGFNYEVFIVDAIENYLDFYKRMKIDLPVLLFISLTGVKDYFVSSDTFRDKTGAKGKLVVSSLLFPGINLTSYDQDIPSTIKFVFDTIWNGCGYKGSDNYDNNGKWKPVY